MEVVLAGVGFVFVILLVVINLLLILYILGFLFFLVLVVVGLSLYIFIMEVVIFVLIDKFGWSCKKVVNIVIGIGFLVFMVFVINGGLLLLDLVDYFVNNVGIMVSCLVELVLMIWLLKIFDVCKYVNSIFDFSVGVWFDICLCFVLFVILVIIVVIKL